MPNPFRNKPGGGNTVHREGRDRLLHPGSRDPDSEIKFLCTTYITSQRIVFWPRYPDQAPSRVISISLDHVEDEQLIAPLIGPDKIRFLVCGPAPEDTCGTYKLKFRNDITNEVLIQFVKMLCKRRYVVAPYAGPVDLEALAVDGANLEIAAAATAMAARFAGRSLSALDPLGGPRGSGSLLTPPRLSAGASSSGIYLTDFVAAAEEGGPARQGTSRPYDLDDLRRSVTLLGILQDRKAAAAAKRRPRPRPRPAPLPHLHPRAPPPPPRASARRPPTPRASPRPTPPAASSPPSSDPAR
eukprot:tig00000865_g5086.t1